MILKHETIDLYGQTLFTWVKLQTPMQNSVPLPAEACFAYILDGDNHIISEREQLKASPGQVVLSMCGHTVGEMITEQEAGKISTLVVHFQRDLLKRVYEDGPPPFWKELDRPVVQYIIQQDASELVKQYFTGIQQLFQYQRAVTEDILVLKLKEIILLLLQTQNSPQVLQIMRSLFSERTFSFKEIVEAHICTPISIENLAMLTNRSLSSFKRDFKKIYKTTPGVYIIEKRAEKVAELLRISDESISNIGYECGFSSAAHLSRVFKAKYGLSPSEYRMTLTVN